MRLQRMVPLLLIVFTLTGMTMLPVTSNAPPTEPNSIVLPFGDTTVRIVRDNFGVPHIYAPTTEGLFYGWGYAVAQDRLFQLELFRRSALGSLAEIFGPDLLPQDQRERRESYTDAEYQQMFEALPPKAQHILEAYRDGINAYLAEIAADPTHKLPWEFWVLGYRPAPWTIKDSMALIRFMARRFGENGGRELRNQADFQTLASMYGPDQAEAMYNDLHWLNDPTAPVTVPATGSTPSASPALRRPLLTLPGIERIAKAYEKAREARIATWKRLSIPPKFGSYAWAITPSRTANGHPLLYGGPQMGFSYPDIIHEVELIGGDNNRWRVFGMGFAGAPLVLIGENKWLAWTSTTGMGDNMDIFVEQLNPANPNQYWYKGAWRDMEVRVEQIPVRTSPIGSELVTTTVPYTVTRTIHGPVVAVDTEHHLAYTEQRQHWLKEQNTWWGFYYFDIARNLEEFAQGVRLIETSHNFIVATEQGDIAYWQSGHVPQRVDGSYVGRFPWPGDGSAEWTGAIRRIPFVANPPQGYVANWNNKAEASFDNGDDSNFGPQFRVWRIFDLLAADDSVTVEDMNRIVKDIALIGKLGMESRFVLGPMLAAVRTHAPGDARLQAAADLLDAWDGHLAEDAVTSTTLSPAAVIFDRWLRKTLTNTFGDEFGDLVSRVNVNHLIHALQGRRAGVPPSRDYFDDVTTPDQVETAADIFVRSLREALDELTAEFGTDDMTQWTPPRGETNFEHPMLGPVGPSIPKSNRSTYAFIAEVGAPTHGWTAIPSGQSAFIAFGEGGAPVFGEHTLDQRPLFRVWEYKPIDMAYRVLLSLIRR